MSASWCSLAADLPSHHPTCLGAASCGSRLLIWAPSRLKPQNGPEGTSSNNCARVFASTSRKPSKTVIEAGYEAQSVMDASSSPYRINEDSRARRSRYWSSGHRSGPHGADLSAGRDENWSAGSSELAINTRGQSNHRLFPIGIDRAETHRYFSMNAVGCSTRFPVRPGASHAPRCVSSPGA